MYTNPVQDSPLADVYYSERRRRYGWALAGTGTVIACVQALSGWHGWISFLCLLGLMLAAWVIDPLILALTIMALSAACLLASHGQWWQSGWMPRPSTVWLTIAFTQLIRLELDIREKARRMAIALRGERDDHREWRAFFDNSPAALLTTDGEGRIIMGNPAARKLLGFENRPFRGQGIAQSLGALGAALRIDRKDTLFHTLAGCTGWRPNGEMFVADAWFSIGETPFGTRLGAVAVDASERLQERARGGLHSSMATSQIAMGAVLHEIRNLSAAAALMYTNLAHAEIPHLEALRKNADFEALGSLLKALAGLAAAELRPGDHVYGSVNLADVLAQLRIIIGPWFSELEMEIEWDVATNLPQVWGDESELLQLFLNLAQNSNKAMLASEEKRLTVEACLEADWVIVRFRDTGPGIANPDELFEPFRRGTGIKGLGLFVSRAIAHSFHGELKYTPTESGSCFTVELLPLREWEKVAAGYENTDIRD